MFRIGKVFSSALALFLATQLAAADFSVAPIGGPTEPPQVRVADSSGQPLAGVAVTFRAPGPGGSFNGKPELTVHSGKDGRAAGKGFTANKTFGTYKIAVTAVNQGQSVSIELPKSNASRTGVSARRKAVVVVALAVAVVSAVFLFRSVNSMTK